jgi:ATP-dependent Lon protease
MEIIPVARVGEVLRHALVRMPEPIEWSEPVASTAPRTDAGEQTFAH